MVQRGGRVGRVAGVLSERGADLPAVDVLRALSRRSGALALVGVVGAVIRLGRRALVGRGADPRPLRAGAVVRMRSVRRVRVHGGHGGRQRAAVGPGRPVEFLQPGLGAGKHARLTLPPYVRAVGGVSESQGWVTGETGRRREERGRRVGGGVVVGITLAWRATGEELLVRVVAVS